MHSNISHKKRELLKIKKPERQIVLYGITPSTVEGVGIVDKICVGVGAGSFEEVGPVQPYALDLKTDKRLAIEPDSIRVKPK